MSKSQNVLEPHDQSEATPGHNDDYKVHCGAPNHRGYRSEQQERDNGEMRPSNHALKQFEDAGVSSDIVCLHGLNGSGKSHWLQHLLTGSGKSHWLQLDADSAGEYSQQGKLV